MFLAAGLLLSKLAASFNKSDAGIIPVYYTCYMLIIITYTFSPPDHFYKK
jgi:hypothetical protein